MRRIAAQPAGFLRRILTTMLWFAPHRRIPARGREIRGGPSLRAVVTTRTKAASGVGPTSPERATLRPTPEPDVREEMSPIPPILRVGCGRIGSAMLAGWRERGLAPSMAAIASSDIPQPFRQVAHTGTASRRARARIRAFRPRSVTMSTGRSSRVSNSYCSPPQVQQRPPGFEVDQEIHVALRVGLAAGDRAKDAHVPRAVLGGDP